MASLGPPAAVSVFRGGEALCEAAAEQVALLAGEAIERSGRFTWALSGGSTPRPIYARLASQPMAGRVEWSRVHFFWVDERCVPPDDAESNYRAARETLLDRVDPPAANVHRVRGEDEPDQAAAAYQQLLQRFFQVASDGPPPRFDLVLLGMGADGHTASLFPGTPPLLETRRWVVASLAGETIRPRVTMTPVIINAAANVTFLVAGSSKAARLGEVLRGQPRGAPWPVQLIRPVDGRLRWLVDEDAAAKLGGDGR
jgi:6-phosphogluconolactonase